MRHSTLTGLISLLFAALTWSCDDGDDSATGGEGGTPNGSAGSTGDAGHAGNPEEGGSAGGGSEGEDACATADPELAEADATGLFDAESVPTFNLVLPEDRWEQLQQDAREEEYVEATACFEGRGIGTVGLRFKGSYGSLYDCFDENGDNTCARLSLKLKFDEYVEDQRFFGLKRLNFQANRYDESYLRERLSFDLFRSMGIQAPRAAWAKVQINGEPHGLFGMVEQIDGRFTADRWPANGDGNLYKETWPYGTSEEWLLAQLKTNEDVGDVSNLLAFSTAMAEADDSELRSTMGEFVDLEYWARYQAVDDAIASYDGITAYYTSDDASWAGNHNFYLYEEAPDHFTIIPWDTESTFTRNSGFGFVPHWTQVPEDCSLTYNAWGGDSLVIAPGCDRVFQALAADLEPYRDAGRELLDGPFSEDLMLEAIDEHAAFIRDAVGEDPTGPGRTGFENAVAFLRSEIPNLRVRFERLLSGEPWVPAQLNTTGATDFESFDDYSLTEGPWIGCNANSTVEVHINTDSPLQGEQDLLMSFEYADEEEGWQHWSNYRMPIDCGSFDVRELTGIRLWLRADEERTLRLDLDSQYSSAASDGIRFGWDVEVTGEGTQVEVRFDDAAIVAWAINEGLDPGDDLDDILRTLNGLVFFPLCNDRNSSGQLGEGETDVGFLEVDDIEFF